MFKRLDFGIIALPKKTSEMALKFPLLASERKMTDAN